MSVTLPDPRTAPEADHTEPRTTAWWRHGLGCLAVVAVLTLAGWYLLADPSTSPLDVYPLPFNAALFWALMFVVWAGFNLELTGFTRLPQPAARAGPDRGHDGVRRRGDLGPLGGAGGAEPRLRGLP